MTATVGRDVASGMSHPYQYVGAILLDPLDALPLLLGHLLGSAGD